MLTENKPLNVYTEVYSLIGTRYNEGRIDRQTYHQRQELAEQAMEALGEEVPDTAIGAELIAAWLSRQLQVAA